MKIAAGCFGCLAVLFLVVAMAFSFGTAVIIQAVPDLAPLLGAWSGTASSVSGSCCCLSGVLAIVLLVAGSMGKKTEEYE
ncbi:MAG: hypothetical protein Q8P41_02550 [Pseudomonadota bacterium]|nr:hypothetical protein [Pseudomonadota bacterium]